MVISIDMYKRSWSVNSFFLYFSWQKVQAKLYLALRARGNNGNGTPGMDDLILV
jgi:hypothetical protein